MASRRLPVCLTGYSCLVHMDGAPDGAAFKEAGCLDRRIRSELQALHVTTSNTRRRMPADSSRFLPDAAEGCARAANCVAVAFSLAGHRPRTAFDGRPGRQWLHRQPRGRPGLPRGARTAAERRPLAQRHTGCRVPAAANLRPPRRPAARLRACCRGSRPTNTKRRCALNHLARQAGLACPSVLHPSSGSPLPMPRGRLVLTWHLEPERLAQWTLVPGDDWAQSTAPGGHPPTPPAASRDGRDSRDGRVRR